MHCQMLLIRSPRQIAAQPHWAVHAIPELDALRGIDVYAVDSGEPSEIVSLCPTTPDPCVLVFFTHWGDLGSWEYAQRLVEARQKIDKAGAATTVTDCSDARALIVRV